MYIFLEGRGDNTFGCQNLKYFPILIVTLMGCSPSNTKLSSQLKKFFIHQFAVDFSGEPSGRRYISKRNIIVVGIFLKLSAMIFVWIEVARDDSSVAEPESK